MNKKYLEIKEMEPIYINKLINSYQLIIDVPFSLMNKEVDIIIIPKNQKVNKRQLSVIDFEGKLSNINFNEFIEHIDNQRNEWERSF